MSKHWSFAALILGLLAMLPGASLRAHTRSVSYSTWELTETGASVRAQVTLLDLSRIGVASPLSADGVARASRTLAQDLRMFAADRPCAPVSGPSPRRAREGWSAWAWELECPQAGNLSIRSDLLLHAAPSHLHFARIRLPDGSVVERVLSETAPDWPLDVAAGELETPASGSSLTDYWGMGIQHILSGWDHLAFVLALLLLARTFGEVVTLVTGFTMAHSVTLGLAVLGVLQPDTAAVEALIGFSIALVGAENAWLLGDRGRLVPTAILLGLLAMAALAATGVGTLSPGILLGLALFCSCHFGLLSRALRPARLRTAIAFAFGLVHGFGFGGFLSGIGLPTDRIVPALLGFNLGVEAGQLAVVAIAWPLLLWLERVRAGGARLVAELGSAAACGLGLFWFLGRALG